jgi:peptidylprolyl isomerase
MKNKINLLLMVFIVSINTCLAKDATKSPSEIIAQTSASDWRSIDNENTLYITLESGIVVVELAPRFAPKHVENTKALVREGVFDDTQFYRVIDGFVAQGGPQNPDKLAKPKKGSLKVKSEFTLKTKQPLKITRLKALDGYANEVGFLDGFAMGRNKAKDENWLTHCYGAFAMGRANDVNSGGTELYIVIGNAQRYLDRNTTVFGRVVAGMQNIQALKRSTDINGAVDIKDQNKILKIQVASDLKPEQRQALQVMKTDSDSFKALIESRKNRMNPWFVYQHNYIDVCSVAVPVQLENK